MGVPKEMLTDQGAQFTSHLMEEISRLLSMRQLVTAPYHPQCNGLIERFNGTLKTIKTMLRRMCVEKPRDWDRYLPAVLFAYREAPQESLGFSPFELLYGRSVRGPSHILRELWAKEQENPEIRTTYQYVIELRNKLEETCRSAMSELAKASARSKRYYDRKAKLREFFPGDRALVLLSDEKNKLLMQWKGPFEIIKKVGLCDYQVKLSRGPKVLHGNLLKLYVDREETVNNNLTHREREKRKGRRKKRVDPGTVSDPLILAGAVIDMTEEGPDTGTPLFPAGEKKETFRDIAISPNLLEPQREDLERLVSRYQDVFTERPGLTNLVEHDIRLTDDKPVRQPMYPTPFAMKETIDREVQQLLAMDLIEPSKSSYSSTIVIVRKSNGSYRFCIDFRKLNKITTFDAEPLPNLEELLASIAQDPKHILSKIDLSKGYWQVPLTPEAREKTAFQTSAGHFQWKVMGFGLVTAPATFSRAMRTLLSGLDGVINYLDDILVFTNTWVEHFSLLTEIFNSLRKAGLTARPTKCMLGLKSLEFMGFQIDGGILKPEQGKVQKILELTIPSTKTQVRALMGLMNYYHRFIPKFAAITAPLTDLTRKGQPAKVKWSEPCQKALETVQAVLSSDPILRLPDLGGNVFLMLLTRG